MLKKALEKISQRRWLQGLLLLVAFFLFDLLLNYTLYNPSFVTPLYSFAVSHHLFKETGEQYPLIAIKEINRGLFDGPRATVIGTVSETQPSTDGDVHINIKNKDGVLVAETIQELPLPLPQVGERVRLWGITRYDIAHRWWEIHPVIGWQKIN